MLITGKLSGYLMNMLGTYRNQYMATSNIIYN